MPPAPPLDRASRDAARAFLDEFNGVARSDFGGRADTVPAPAPAAVPA